MNNLVRKPESLLTQNESELLQALKEQRFVDMSPEAIKGNAFKIVSDAAARIGQSNVAENILKVAMEDLEYSLNRELKQMTMSEIQIAIRTQSKLEKTYSISSRVIFDWVNTWRQTAKLELQKNISIKAKRDKTDLPPRVLSKEEKLNAIEREFIRWSNGERPFTKVYVYLSVFGWLTSDENKPKIFEQAVKELTLETRENTNQMTKPYRDQRLGELKDAKNEPGLAKYILNRCMEIAIRELFEGMRDMDTSPIKLSN